MAKNSKIPFTFTLPKELLAQLAEGCLSYTPIPNVPFSSQQGTTYDPKHSAWCINAIIYAYREFCDKKSRDLFPPDVEDAQHLYWHEDLNILNEKVPCGYIARIKQIPGDSTNRIVIAFRGTEKLSEWLENLDYTQKQVTFENLDQTVEIHTGFWDAVYEKANHHTVSLQDQINQLIPTYLSKTGPNEINITGHSLGAAVATIVSLDAILRYSDTRIVTFIIGSPRVGGPSLSALVRDLSGNSKYNFVLWRLVNTEDIVPTVPAPVVGEVVYSQVYVSKPTAANKVGGVTFSDNLANIGYNHHPLTYNFANDQLMPDNPSPNPVKGVDQKPGNDKKSA